MSVRAKFTVQQIQRMNVRRKDGEVELQTITLSPVYGNGDPNHENTRFWEASPSGEIKLGTVNPDAWRHFELGKSYYIDFTLADD